MSRNYCQQFELSEIEYGTFDAEDDYICLSCLQSDDYKIGKNPIECIIKNYFNQCLAAQYEGPDNVIAVFLTTESAPQSKDQKNFLIEKYRTAPPSEWLSVAFAVSVNKKQYHLCCTSEKQIVFKPGNCPSIIRGDKSEVIFFLQEFSKGHTAFKFESSLHKDHFLAFKEENGKQILYLKKPTDEVDESTKFNIDSKQ
ncbi:interleukin-18-like [Pyxicephalus adspersus]|uniref:Interleukin-18 n=1 Tax=Pyxicephalus adspersus TaxID=30357 RepID=A0AAV3A2A8_PYXAD|nr:TPA: hypothetical protein GDO54_003651 [Pyxicephalus adspersus]